MGVYIIGKKPDRCGICPCFHAENPMYCQAVKAAVQKPRIVRPYAKGRPEWCPLIEIPEPHGRLIDADALHKLFEDQWHYLQVLDWNENPTAEANQSGINWCINTMHDDAPTVIPASEEE